MLEKSTNYLISDKIIDPILNHSSNTETSVRIFALFILDYFILYHVLKCF